MTAAVISTRLEKNDDAPSRSLLAPGAVVVSADGGSVDSMLDEVLPK
ncbi:hypothetical protein L6R49_29610 [Myxococcota bacterium]|nr:hypothetical protein [Myxococcota bacterium]